MPTVAAILGSAHDAPRLGPVELEPRSVSTPYGTVELHRFPRGEGEAWVLFRHGLPHRYLPHQIPLRAQAAALKAVGCEALLVTSSVGILDPALPLDTPLLVRDLLMLDNRLPDGTPCTMFLEPGPGQGHLVLQEGLFSPALSRQVADLLQRPDAPRVLFAHVPGPRTKTSAENAVLGRLGAQVNSMTLGPEVVLANELEIPTAGLVVGHKHSRPDHPTLASHTIAATLQRSRDLLEQPVLAWLRHGRPVPFGNQLYRFG